MAREKPNSEEIDTNRRHQAIAVKISSSELDAENVKILGSTLLPASKEIAMSTIPLRNTNRRGAKVSVPPFAKTEMNIKATTASRSSTRRMPMDNLPKIEVSSLPSKRSLTTKIVLLNDNANPTKTAEVTEYPPTKKSRKARPMSGKIAKK